MFSFFRRLRGDRLHDIGIIAYARWQATNKYLKLTNREPGSKCWARAQSHMQALGRRLDKKCKEIQDG